MAMTPKMESHKRGAANQRIMAITIRQQTIAITSPIKIDHHERTMSSTIFCPSCIVGEDNFVIAIETNL